MKYKKGINPLPRMHVEEGSLGIIRWEGVDRGMTSWIMAGTKAREIAKRCNAHEELVKAVFAAHMALLSCKLGQCDKRVAGEVAEHCGNILDSLKEKSDS